MPVTHYIWDELSDNVLQETDENGTTTVEYTCRPDKFGSVLSQRRDGHTYTHHYDALGSTRQLTDESGAVTDTYDYDAWGNEIASSGTTENPYRFCGQHGYCTDLGAKDIYVRARTYNPLISRWASEDPSQFADSSNGFIYSGNRPLSSIDPSGETTEDLIVRPSKGGRFNVTVGATSSAEYCCESIVTVNFKPTQDDKKRYSRITLNVFVRTRTWKEKCCLPFFGDCDSGWHQDNMTIEPPTPWTPTALSSLALPSWDDAPGVGPPKGSRNKCNLCRTKKSQQDYEVCAIGTRYGIGRKREILGCVTYGHRCTFKYTYDVPYSNYCCKVSCNNTPYGSNPDQKLKLPSNHPATLEHPLEGPGPSC